MTVRAVTFPTVLFVNTMDVYATDPATGARDVVIETAVPCRLAESRKKDILAGFLRTQGTELRTLIYPVGVDLSSAYQVQIDGQRWTLQSGTDQFGRGPSGEVVYQTFDVARSLA